MAVTITQKSPSNNSVVLGWNSNPPANVDANAYVSPNQSDLSNPPNFPSAVISVPADQTGLLPGVSSFTATINGLLPGTLYYVLCEADGSYSPYPDSFTTTGTPPPPPVSINDQDVAITLGVASPMSVSFDWIGPDATQGQVWIGSSPMSLALAGTDTNMGARHSYMVNQGINYSQTYYCQVVSVDSGGNPVSQGPVLAFATPMQPNNNLYLAAPPLVPPFPRPLPFPPVLPPHYLIPFVSNTHIHPGGRSVITVDTRNGAVAAANALVEFSLSDPTMGKLGHGNLIGGSLVQVLSDPYALESVVFISSGKTGSVAVGVRVMGSTHVNSTARAVIQVS